MFNKLLYDRKYSRKYRQEHPEWKKIDNRKRLKLIGKLSMAYYKKYPEKLKAKLKVYFAIKRGTMKRNPCIICGNPRSLGHHPDYSKPLEVTWLCSKHHQALHNNLL